ncbi:MAG: VOC family protein [Eudoraea sp.]|nr:VOC family protein [Eudoraea sp.]MBT8211397.1 VOC family protein [Eudoraea sp.]MBT8223236.1 VOC family protein [Eudoraea sp.]MBT8322526.1 VOC family protein [Eudoraea sp.]NNK30094.1 VOC family protein [Flavobacteriaceae bacterium]
MKHILLTVLFLGLYTSNAQNFDFKYDHYSFIVQDLKKVGDFYADVLKLEEIPHPSDPDGFRWFKIRGNSQLHLIGKDTVIPQENKSVHLCLSTAKLDAFIEHLNYKKIPFWDWPGKEGAITTRADGVKQIYILDPEKNWVEINNAKH